jgi:hypothetical protein
MAFNYRVNADPSKTIGISIPYSIVEQYLYDILIVSNCPIVCFLHIIFLEGFGRL